KSRAGSDHRPTAAGNRVQQHESARDLNDSIGSGLAVFDLLGFSNGVEMRSNTLNHFNSAHAVRSLHDVVGIETIFARPAGVLLGDDAGGIEQNAVKVEEDGGAGKRAHGKETDYTIFV